MFTFFTDQPRVSKVYRPFFWYFPYVKIESVGPIEPLIKLQNPKRDDWDCEWKKDCVVVVKCLHFFSFLSKIHGLTIRTWQWKNDWYFFSRYNNFLPHLGIFPLFFSLKYLLNKIFRSIFFRFVAERKMFWFESWKFNNEKWISNWILKGGKRTTTNERK